MKKIIATAAFVAAAAAVTAQTVTSANIVGYAKNTQPAGGFVMAAPAQFTGEAGSVTLADAFSGVVDQDKVYVFNGAAYDIYTYWPDFGGWKTAVFGDANGVALDAGTAAWLTGTPAAETIMSGEVPSTNSFTLALTTGFNLIANPYPVAIKLKDIDTTNLSGYVASPFTEGEQIYVFNGAAYDIYQYWPDFGGWVNAVFSPAGEVEIPVGAGFFMSMVADGDVTFDRTF